MKLEFLFDYASPWAYLANELLPQKFPHAEIEYVPTYIRGLELFSTGMPYGQTKLLYILKDLERCAKHEQIPLVIPAEFPINGLYALRGAVWTLRHGGFAAYHQTVFRATWAGNAAISSKDVVIGLAEKSGLDAKAFAAGIEQPEIKEVLKTSTARQQERGVFGVPAFWVGDDLFWGHDRMDYVARALTPPTHA